MAIKAQEWQRWCRTGGTYGTSIKPIKAKELLAGDGQACVSARIVLLCMLPVGSSCRAETASLRACWQWAAAAAMLVGSSSSCCCCHQAKAVQLLAAQSGCSNTAACCWKMVAWLLELVSLIRLMLAWCCNAQPINKRGGRFRQAGAEVRGWEQEACMV